MRYATTIPHNDTTKRVIASTIARDTAILVVAYAIATYFRQPLPLGKYVDDTYTWLNPSPYTVILLGAIISRATPLPLWTRGCTPSRRDRLFVAFLSLGAALILLTVILPGQSELQRGYFSAAVVLLLLIVPVLLRQIAKRSCRHS